jgi:tetratricopeptide (TPR) repeat protein
LAVALNANGKTVEAIEQLRAAEKFYNDPADPMPDPTDKREYTFIACTLGEALTLDGDLDGASKSLDAGIAIADAICKISPGDFAIANWCARMSIAKCAILQKRADWNRALALATRAQSLGKELMQHDGAAHLFHRSLARSLEARGQIALAQNDANAARSCFEQSLAEWKAIGEQVPDLAVVKPAVASIQAQLDRIR